MLVLLAALVLLSTASLAALVTGMVSPEAVFRGRGQSRRHVVLVYGIISLSLAVLTLMTVQAGDFSIREIYKKVSLAGLFMEKKSVSALPAAEVNAKAEEASGKASPAPAPAVRGEAGSLKPPDEEKNAGQKQEKQSAQTDSGPAAPSPPAEARPAEKVKKSQYALLNPKVSYLRFFEGGYNPPPEGQRVFKNVFPVSKTRFVYWEAGFVHNPPGRQISFEIEAVYYTEDNNVYASQITKHTVESWWDHSFRYYSWGNDQPGMWRPGSYRLDLLVDGVRIASGRFQVNEF